MCLISAFEWFPNTTNYDQRIEKKIKKRTLKLLFDVKGESLLLSAKTSVTACDKDPASAFHNV